MDVFLSNLSLTSRDVADTIDQIRTDVKINGQNIQRANSKVDSVLGSEERLTGSVKTENDQLRQKMKYVYEIL